MLFPLSLSVYFSVPAKDPKGLRKAFSHSYIMQILQWKGGEKKSQKRINLIAQKCLNYWHKIPKKPPTK